MQVWRYIKTQYLGIKGIFSLGYFLDNKGCLGGKILKQPFCLLQGNFFSSDVTRSVGGDDGYFIASKTRIGCGGFVYPLALC